MNLLEQYNQQFAIEARVSFSKGKGDLPFVTISTPHSTATISLQGGQVIGFKPVDAEQDMLFVSKNAYYETDKSIKGGAPICWPWFAANPDNAALPFHGFVRNQLWQVQATESHENGDVVITLLFKDSDKTSAIWPYAFELKEVITIGQRLSIDLITKNTGTEVLNLTQAIHTYFSIGDITQVQVSGLENKTYLDKVDQYALKKQAGPITVRQEVDRIYQQVDTPLVIHDAAWNRQIHIAHSGSATAVVWNPWIDISRNSQDLEDDDYQRFICVETANAADDVVTIMPGDAYTLTASYYIEA